MIQKNDKIVIGISGGADSIALAHFLYSVKEQYCLGLYGVHVHHGLRAEKADKDRDFVARFCKEYEIMFLSFHEDIKKEAQITGLSEEEAGRNARYRDFEKASLIFGANKIAVAHNQNDQAETLLMRLCRGTGLKGLTGIPPVRGKIVRPLLEVARQEIEAYCNKNEISFCVDETNAENIYTRNKIRNQILPYLVKEINADSIGHIAKTASLLSEEEQFLEKLAYNLYHQALLKKTNDELSLNSTVFFEQDPVLIKRVLRLALMEMSIEKKDLSFSHLDAVYQLLKKDIGKFVCLTKNLRVQRVKEGLKIYLERKSIKQNHGFCYLLEEDQTIYLKEIDKFVRLSSNKNKNISKSVNMCTNVFDYDKIKNSVLIRTRKPGDKIVLKGLDGKKKVKDYFIDQKIPIHLRDQIPLVADGSDILWIMGHRASNWYLADEDTKHIVTIQAWEDA